MNECQLQHSYGTFFITKILILFYYIVSSLNDSLDFYRQTNSGALIRQRTIPSERPPLVGEVSANFSG
jgi:hypothetical protein